MVISVWGSLSCRAQEAKLDDILSSYYKAIRHREDEGLQTVLTGYRETELDRG